MEALRRIDTHGLAGGGTPDLVPERGRVRSYLDADPALRALYTRIRTEVYPIVSSNYDLTRRCNLRCEGCLFFSGSDYEDHPEESSVRRYDSLFRAEARRGVNFPYFVGAEPSLAQDRLRAAARHFRRGVVFTNGTIRIHPEIPFAIHVSLWGGEARTRSLRGGRLLHKPLRNYQGDRRATFIYTINHRNIGDIAEAVSLCDAHGTRISFNHFSATTRYLRNLETGTPNDRRFFRISNADDNLRLTGDDLKRAHDIVERMMEDHPETVIYSRRFNDWISRPEGLYRLDPASGWALDCETRNAPYHRHYHTDLTADGGKCCAPNLDCADCRAYAMAYATFRRRLRRFLGSKEAFAGWLEAVDTWCRLFLVGWDR